jgi:hypothetical protein
MRTLSVLTIWLSCSCTLVLAQAPEAQPEPPAESSAAQKPGPLPASRPLVYVPPFDAQQIRERHRAQKQEAKQAKLRARHDERARLDAQLRPYLDAPRLHVQLGFMPVLVARSNPDGSASRFRTGTVTLGLAFRQHYRSWLGLHAGFDVGAGGSRMVFAEHPGSACCGPERTRTGAAYSGSIDLAPIFGPCRDISLSPGVQLRALWPSQRSARVAYDSLEGDEVRVQEVRFRRPLMTAGLRMTVGVILRARRLWDLAIGFDVARPLYDADRSIGMVLKLGTAVGQR